MNFHFILVEPAVPENVGFSVRAIKTMGFTSMRLVNPCDHLSAPARKTAYASHDILLNIPVYPDLGAAIDGLDLTLATTAKKRTSRIDVYRPEELPALLKSKEGGVREVGIVFGREESGLTKEEINLCDILTTVPLYTTYPSLNLAQSVMVYAYALSGFNLKAKKKRKPKKGNISMQAELRDKSREILEWLDMSRHPSLRQRMIDRIMQASEDDMHLMLSFIKKLDHKRKG